MASPDFEELLERLQRDIDRAYRHPDLSSFVVPVGAGELQDVLDEIERLRHKVKTNDHSS